MITSLKIATLTASAALVLGAASVQGEPRRSGLFGAETTSLTPVYVGDVRELSLESPDGRTVVRAHALSDDVLALDISGALGRRRFRVVNGPNSEMAWAPDSQALFVTLNDGGAIGDYELNVIGRFGGRLGKRDLTPFVQKIFGHPVRCYDPEAPNVAGVTWLGASDRLIAAAEIVPHSNCDSMGTFRLYELDPYRMTIRASYDQLTAKRRFRKALGRELAAAEDGCVRDPRSCWIPQLHRQKP